MKKAKNAFAIIAIILAVVAAAILVLHPVIENLASSLSEDGYEAVDFVEYLDLLKDSAKLFYNLDWVKDFDVELLKVYYPVVIFAVGDVLFIVLFILMLCKRHAKGLGWWFPMAILFELSTLVAFIYYPVKIIDLEIVANQFHYSVSEILGWVGLIGSLTAAGFFILSTIFYMVYVCNARKQEKKVDSARQAALAKIESLLGGNK